MDIDQKGKIDEAVGWKYANKAMSWYGWGSPVGLGMFPIGLDIFLVLLRRTIFGA